MKRAFTIVILMKSLLVLNSTARWGPWGTQPRACKYRLANVKKKFCSGLLWLVADRDFRCSRCLGTVCAINVRTLAKKKIDNDELEVVDSFCYLVDMLSAGGRCDLATVTRVKTAWKKFRSLCQYWQRATWHLRLAVTFTTLAIAQFHDRAMIRLLCHVKPSEVPRVGSRDLLDKVGLIDL